jgi:hypothetical protein
MWLLSQYSSQQCGVYTYILAVAEFSSSSINEYRHRRTRPILHLFLMLNCLPLAHNLDNGRPYILSSSAPIGPALGSFESS